MKIGITNKTRAKNLNFNAFIFETYMQGFHESITE